MKTDTDIRKDLYSNIVLLGWNYMFIGIGKYMVTKLAEVAKELENTQQQMSLKP